MAQNCIYSAADYKSDVEVKWCPGCGDHAVLNSMEGALAALSTEDGTAPEDFAVVSGIGCSSRLPYYVKTYGFHGIHGRAVAIATGVKVANPRLKVWVASGDGDALAIGGNHFIHAVRRNIDLTMILFNNEIYGLTKGQYSPTTKLGKVTKTSPLGTIEKPFKPGELAVGAGVTFFARSVDAEVALTKELLMAGSRHRGMSVVEVLVNCVIFNDKTHSLYAGDKATRAEHTIQLRHGERMIFGANRDKGLTFDGQNLKVVKLGERGVTEDDLLVHDAHAANPTMHFLLAGMCYPDYPVALGVIRQIEAPVYDVQIEEQVVEQRAKAKIRSVDDLLRHGETIEVK
jgi:2-oxoglutarate ferredoxin oxidoreductase subunit beta